VTAVSTRLVRLDDAAHLGEARSVNRDRLRPYEPSRTDAFFTVAGQRSAIEQRLERHGLQLSVPLAIIDDHGAIVGEMTLDNIVRGAFQSATVGYWVAAHVEGRGVASSALRDLQAMAFGALGLHRLEAGTLVHNTASQKVLERAGFVRYGSAPDYLQIDGRWQEHALYQCIAPRSVPPAEGRPAGPDDVAE
jgi:ribosomal-protein-alanine N-acetyltransferase